MIFSLFRITIQCVYTVLQFNGVKDSVDESVQFGVPMWVIIFASISPIIVFVINEVTKSQEIM